MKIIPRVSELVINDFLFISLLVRDKNFEKNQYIYSYVDHLGNVRLSYFKNANGSAEVLEENNFYPFGLKHDGYNALSGNPAYNYEYSGKELQKETGWSDFGARMYMADIGRWGVIDPLAETTTRINPYNYALNNPVMFIDPDGRKAYDPEALVVDYARGGALEFYMRGGFATFGSFDEFLGRDIFGFHKAPSKGVYGGGGSATTFGETQAYADIMAYLAEPESESGSYFQGINFTQFGADGGPGGPSAQLSDPIIGKKVLDAKTSFLGRLWANGQPRTWTENGITYNVDADGKISGVTPYQGDVPLGPAGSFNILKAYKSGLSLFKGGSLTNIGRAVTKHPQYFGFESTEALMKVFRNPSAINKLGADMVKDILRNGVKTTGAGGRYPQGWVTYTLPNGNAASWSVDGIFIGFRGLK